MVLSKWRVAFVTQVNRLYIQFLPVDLRDGAMPLSEVAASLGLSNQSRFNRIFSKYTGFTPTAYRKTALANACSSYNI